MNQRFKGILILAGAVLLVLGLRSLPVGGWIEEGFAGVKALGPAGPVLLVLLYVVTSLLLIPASAVTLLIGGAYGLWHGLLIVIAGANLAALVSFLLSRTLLRERVLKWAAGNARFEALDRAIGREGFKMVLLSRLSPVFPFTLLNYFLGLTTVRTGVYVVANLLGMLPGTFLYVYLGATARQALTGGARVLLNVVGLLATVAVVALATRMARRAMAEAEERDA